ncbi:unnamed protein product [Mytilus coruscus]|uniref:Uncharacterized protein n=1 Tax=Mytilus coruscus TaxID=42192 RepID=A0A6J8DXV2_MYTCO|nr:unnamed protein product [Mytilus coruscus]
MLKQLKRSFVITNKKKTYKKNVGFDANALYLWSLNHQMPTGSYTRKKEDNEFRPEVREKYMSAYYWMDWLQKTTDRDTKHKLNHSREKCVGAYPVDGFCAETSTIFQFHGCNHHGYDCFLTKNIQIAKWRSQRTNKLIRIQNTSTFLWNKDIIL